MAYSSNYQGNFEIYKIAVSSLVCNGTQTRLTNNSTVDRQPNWSTDNSKILFQSNRDDNNEIYSISSSNGLITERLTANGADDAYPAMQPVPALRINDVTVSEPANGTATMTFTAALSMKFPQPISVMYATADGTAIGGNDYQSDAGTINFNANETSKTFTVTVNSDAVQENFEHFFVNLSNATNAAITDAQGRGTIRPPVYNGKIAYESNRGTNANYEIFVSNPDGSGEINITNNSASDSRPAWSPDGTKIAFLSYRNSQYQILVTDPEGLLTTPIFGNSSFKDFLTWSPDGTKLAFIISNQIWTVDADGANPTILTDPTVNVSRQFPVWSPDGTKIAYSQAGQNFFTVINADGSNPTTINVGASVYSVHWSPDGSKFVIGSYQSPGTQICTINIDGTNRTCLTNDFPTGNEGPQWSPDGTQISWSRAISTGNYELFANVWGRNK